MPLSVEDLRNNYEAVLERIESARNRAGRPDDVRLIAVSKTHPIDVVERAIEAGITLFGENRPQELKEKAEALDGAASWCAIGQLQRNKAKDVARYANEFHALDSLKVADALERRLATEERTLRVYVQVNVSNEPQKSGVLPDELPEFLHSLHHSHLDVRGLMTIARNAGETEVRRNFCELRSLRDAVARDFPSVKELSMGMSNDFEWAIEEGATTVRVGSAIFGAR